MARFVIYLNEQERSALYCLAQRERRVPKAQAALIIHTELERLGMLPLGQFPAGTVGAFQVQAGLPEAAHDTSG